MIQIMYPRGSGGNWLSNLIWHLEHNDTTLPVVDTVFDKTQKCSIRMSHGFEIFDPHKPDVITYYNTPLDNVVFSCSKLFNHYLNNAVKVKFHIHRLVDQPLQSQLFELSNGAYYYFTNKHYYSQYCENIVLDYQLIFQDPEQFVDQLFDLLNTYKIKYVANRDYAYTSINYYKNTCPNPADHYGNLKSKFWLGCCHALALLDNLPLSGIIDQNVDIDFVSDLFVPWNEHCKKRIAPMMFEWKNEFTQ